MGASDSKAGCKDPLPQELCAITLSDSAVQRIPQGFNDSPGEKEQRRQNVDDYWRDRIDCMEHAYQESVRLTEKEFRRLENAIRAMAPGTGKYLCPRLIEEATTCYLTYPNQSLICSGTVKKLQLCLDTIMQDKMKKRLDDSRRKQKKKKC